ncbi:MAG TPA: mycofactocin-coupled SDR family oxidoreductase [Pseudonocardia sp.]|nr:mycofactocin-coupled SDR family oxidoreductase [Pseudonocardia sp.]
MGRMDGKVALVTGAARGQGRSHAIRLAEEGAEIIAVDLCAQIGTVPYGMSNPEDLAETAKRVEELDRRILAKEADVRDTESMAAAVSAGLAEFGHIDVVCANAGIFSVAPTWEMTDEMWDDMIAVNVTGVWKTLRAVLPSMIERGQGGSLILTSSTAGLRGFQNMVHYTAAKHGVVGIMRTMVQEVSQYSIRCNTIHPSAVDTDMIQNQAMYKLFMPDAKPEELTRENYGEAFKSLHTLPHPWVEARDISNAVLWLASDESRYVTGQTIAVDLGFLEKV